MILYYDDYLVGLPKDLIAYLIDNVITQPELEEFVEDYKELIKELEQLDPSKLVELYENPMSASPMISDRTVILCNDYDPNLPMYECGISEEDDYDTELKNEDTYIVFNCPIKLELNELVVVYQLDPSGVLGKLEGECIGHNVANDPIVEVY